MDNNLLISLHPWLADHVSLISDIGIINLPCQASKIVLYTSRYQEMDAGNLTRILYPTRELRKANYTNLPPCSNKLGVLLVSDIHQIHLCPYCKVKVREAIILTLRRALAQESLNGHSTQ